MPPQNDHLDPLETLQATFGFSSLRPGQDSVVQAVMAGKDTLAIMPTGGGKSLCYQLPALCRPGLTLVVSPLIALMKDQVDALEQRGIPAVMINSTLTAEEHRERLRALRQQTCRILYVAPERFAQDSFMSLLAETPISLIAIDEAHCLSQWGHDFRPDYLRLGRVIEQLGHPQTIALTATATRQVREDILNHLRLRDPAVIISGFARDNLTFRTTPCDTQQEKLLRLHQLIREWKTGIIYCSTRKKVMTVFGDLKEHGINAIAYHAGLTDAEREYAQNQFINREADIAVATNAFGMGIDRADVRFVAHYEIPGSVEAYYQEAGRAGRDGRPAHCELLFNHADLRTQEYFFEGSNPGYNTIADIYTWLRRHSDPDTHTIEATIDEIADSLRIKNTMGISSAIATLVHAGAIQRYDIPGKTARGTRICHPDLPATRLGIDREHLREKETRDHAKIETVTQYAYSHTCRQQWILDYFGEPDPQPCGRCDICLPPDAATYPALEGEPLLIVRKALSGIARASRRRSDGTWEAIFGRNKIMQMLRGAQSPAIAHMTDLSTYGILKNLSENAIKALFRCLAKAGCLATTGGDRPLLTLSRRGHDIMTGQTPATIPTTGWAGNITHSSMRGTTSSRTIDGIALGQPDRALYDLLSALRKNLAHEQGIPPYRIMTNETLLALSAVKPLTAEAAMPIKGIGPATAEKYLPHFLDLIAEYEEE